MHEPSVKAGFDGLLDNPREDDLAARPLLPRSRPMVLAVDDDPIVFEALRRLAASPTHGFDYLTASSCAEAMQLLTERRPAALLVDYMLDDGYGTDLVPLCMAPVVVMTGNGSESVAVEALRAGATDYLIKDVEGRFVKLVEATIERALARHRADLLAREAIAELRVSQRENRALEKFASLIGASLSMPLQNVSHYCGLMLTHRPVEQDRLAMSYARGAFAGARRASNLIAEVLEFSRVHGSRGAFGVVELKMVVERVLQDLKALTPPNQSSLVVEPLPAVWGDEEQLRMALRRLLHRAILRGSAEGRPLALRVGGRSVGGGNIELRIEDGGPPVSADERRGADAWDELSGPDGRTLDLAIARRVVERHRGHLWLGGGGDSGEPAFVAVLLPDTSGEAASESGA